MKFTIFPGLAKRSGAGKLQFSNDNHKSGFTMVELLIVMAIMTTLTTLVFVSLDPITRFSEARNSRRQTDVNSILTAIHEYIIDNDGTLPTGLTTTEKQLGTCTTGGATLCTTAAAACLDWTTTPPPPPLARYLKSLPTDPGDGTTATTGYSVKIDSNNIVTIKACKAELTETIEASR